MFKACYVVNNAHCMLLLTKGGLTRSDLYDTICMTLFGFKLSSHKSEEIELILSFKNRIIQISMPKVVKISQFTRSD